MPRLQATTDGTETVIVATLYQRRRFDGRQWQAPEPGRVWALEQAW